MIKTARRKSATCVCLLSLPWKCHLFEMLTYPEIEAMSPRVILTDWITSSSSFPDSGMSLLKGNNKSMTSPVKDPLPQSFQVRDTQTLCFIARLHKQGRIIIYLLLSLQNTFKKSNMIIYLKMFCESVG